LQKCNKVVWIFVGSEEPGAAEMVATQVPGLGGGAAGMHHAASRLVYLTTLFNCCYKVMVALLLFQDFI
jgi:hypothetical protein